MLTFSAQLLVGATIAVLGTCLVLVVVVIAVRMRRQGRQKRDEMLLAPLRGPLITVASGEDDDGAATEQLTWATGVTRDVLDSAIVDLLTKIRGLPAEQLVGVLTAHGAVDRAKADLSHRSLVRRAKAAQMLGLAGGPDAVPLLVEALGDSTVQVRNSAAWGLGLIGDASAAGAVLTATGGEQGGIPASTSAETLQSMGVGISDVLATAFDDGHARTRMVAAHVTGDRSFTRGLPALRRLLADDPDLTVRETCATAIGRLGREEDVSVLARHVVTDEPLSLRRACAAALGELGESGAVPVLATLLDDADPRLAEIAASALLGLGADGRAALAGREDTAPVRAARTVADLQRASA
ncbi:HEAT repeat domain-containing protein [Intrasporangium sp. YIM S08009]|uniref:HEAT repeat domain-containing protein n=1 Tax=Intrasporangium zincisolvens TaxID=3080018 RepID=UPI002B05D770|nr:HEAT repeat domain-containing protein [Intrasporangium sp. YIM S08009]